MGEDPNYTIVFEEPWLIRDFSMYRSLELASHPQNPRPNKHTPRGRMVWILTLTVVKKISNNNVQACNR